MSRIKNISPQWLIGIAALFIILAGLKAASAIATPILLGFFISIILAPPLTFMTKKGVPASLAIVFLILILIVISALFVVFVGSSVDSFSSQLPLYQKNLQTKTLELLPYLKQLGIPVTQEQFLQVFNTSVIFRWTSYLITGVGNTLKDAFVVLLVVVFVLMETAQFANKLKIARKESSLQKTGHFIGQVNQYLLIKTSASFATGVLVGIPLMFMGVDFPMLWGILAFVMNFIPTIGSIIAAVPPVILSLVQFDWQIALVVIAIYLVVNTVIGNFLEPRYMGKGLGLSPLVVFLSLMIWGYIFGLIGMFLSIPLTMIVKIALEQSSSTQWLAIMIGSGDDLELYKSNKKTDSKNTKFKKQQSAQNSQNSQKQEKDL